ncbi:MAG TPA: phosphotransferase family protein [Acidimicrobiales bacterium]|nr:phosphotransferase family protein [Acidimicrobiales bacterium]
MSEGPMAGTAHRAGGRHGSGLDDAHGRAHGAPRPDQAVDVAALEAYLCATIDGLHGPLEVSQFEHGHANLTYLLRLGGRDLVLRRPPLGPVAPLALDMYREHCVLAALGDAYPRAPRALLYCADAGVIGAPFVIMEHRVGVTIRSSLPPTLPGEDAGRRASEALIDALVDLHQVEPLRSGLGEMGRPRSYAERHLTGWLRRLRALGVDRSALPLEEVGEGLLASLPRPQRTSIVHNDFTLDNCQFAPGRPDVVTTVLDWDMACLGDPLLDLGILLAYWPDPDDPISRHRVMFPGLEQAPLARRQEMVGWYAERSPLRLRDLAWYEAFGLWRAAVVNLQLRQRFAEGQTRDRRLGDRGRCVTPLTQAAQEALGRFRAGRS